MCPFKDTPSLTLVECVAEPVILPGEIVEWAVDAALQRICCDDNFPEHCLEVLWYAVSRQPWAEKYLLGDDVSELLLQK